MSPFARSGRMLFASLAKGAVLLIAAISLVPQPLGAQQSSLSVTVTPPLFQLTIGPGENWSSAVKVVNNNGEDVTYYATVMNFEAEGESGRGKMTPIVDQSPGDIPHTLAGWISLPERSVRVAPGASAEVPFMVNIPESASPGGHYAAILIGTQPPSDSSGNVVKVSSYVTSLIFVRIKGDVQEQGRIREFITDRAWYETPSAKFSLRFENSGNTHLQPQGDIKIFNMWGKERGSLEINQKSNFGNVLPKSVRKFEFSWEGEASAFDIGRYSAIVTLGYGEEGKQNTHATTYFWIVPVVPVASTLAAIIFFALFIVWSIRRYVRRALALSLSAELAVLQKNSPATPQPAPEIHPQVTLTALAKPLREGVIDLRSLASRGEAAVPVAVSKERSESAAQRPITASQFAAKYRIFLVFVIVMIVGAIALWWYFNRALTPARSFQITDVVIQEEPVETFEIK